MPSEAKGHELAKKSRMEREFHCQGLHDCVQHEYQLHVAIERVVSNCCSGLEWNGMDPKVSNKRLLTIVRTWCCFSSFYVLNKNTTLWCKCPHRYKLKVYTESISCSTQLFLQCFTLHAYNYIPALSVQLIILIHDLQS